MKYSDRKGNIIDGDNKQDILLKNIYSSKIGRAAIKILVNPVFSKIGGAFLSSGISSFMIPSFCRKNNINIDDYEERKYISYNDFFTRKIKPGRRVFDPSPEILISPCDSKLTVYPIDNELKFSIKNTKYTVASLLRDSKLAKRYEGGTLCVFRLTVDDYHRYAYIDNGSETRERRIEGILHTVNPIANDFYPIYKENSRTYSILKTENFGNVLMMEVGALMVGKIVNDVRTSVFKKGQEKGHFEFGGSTIILMFEKNKVVFDKDILENSGQNIETKVCLGETIGRN